MYLYVIYDKLAAESGPVFEAKNDQVALRQFKKAIEPASNKNEYQLYRIGAYDNEKLECTSFEAEEILDRLTKSAEERQAFLNKTNSHDITEEND